MTSDAIKLRRLEIKVDREKAQLAAAKDLARLIITNPVAEIVGGFVLIELLQRYPTSRPIIGNWQGNLMETGLAGIITAQQIAPLLPTMGEAAGSLLKAAGPLTALLGAL